MVDLIKEIGNESTKTWNPRHWLQTSDFERLLNKLGAEGWELANIQFILEREEVVVVGFFKRHQ